LLLAAVGAAAFAATGCGGSAAADDLAPFDGRWVRVEAGASNPGFTLDIERSADGAQLTFANGANGMSQSVAGTVEDGYVACTLATTNDPFLLPAGPGRPSPGATMDAPASANLQLSLEDGGQLIVDLVLADGTLEPIWFYQRAEGASASPTDGMSPSAPGTN
jgi:hypothetical protein